MSVPFANGTALLTVPAGAIAGTNGAPVTATLTAYGIGSQMGVTFQNAARAAQSVGRTTQGVPAGSQFIVGFSIALSAGYLVAPLQVSLPTVNPPLQPASMVERLSIYNPTPTGTSKPSFFDVDTATIGGSGSVISNDVNAKYVSISSANPAQPYAFYAVPAANAATPAPITLTASSQPVGPSYLINSSVVFTASGADANGNPLAFIPAFSLSSSALGTLSPGSTLYSTVLKTGANQVTGTLNIADSRTKTTGSVPVKVVTVNPVTAGNTYTYAGSMSQQFSQNYPLPVTTFRPSPYPTGVTTTTTTKSAQVVTVIATASPGTYVFNAVDTETGLATSQTMTNTVYTYPSNNSGNVTISSISTTGAPISNTPGAPATYALSQIYAAPYISDILPESAGQTWTNTSAFTLTETDADTTKAVRTYNADGSYIEKTTYPQGSANGTPPPANVGTITVNSNGSGSYSVPYLGQAANRVLTFGTPVPNPSGTPYIPLVVNGRAEASAVWYPTPLVLFSENDSNLGAVTIPAACNVPASFGTTASAVQQTIGRVDPVIGYVDVQTTTTYRTPGIGTTCVQYNDVNKTYYGYNGQTPPIGPTTVYIYVMSNGVPIQTTTTTQTLGLQSATVAGSSLVRAPQALSGVEVRAANAAFQRVVQEVIQKQRAAMNNAALSILKGGL